MADRRQALATMPDDALADALRQLATALDFSPAPTESAAPDLATRVRRHLELSPARPSVWQRLGLGAGLGTGLGGGTGAGAVRGTGRPIRRGLVLAIVALLVLAAVAGAVGLGLPGLRIIFGEPPSPAPPATGAPTTSLPPPSGPTVSPTLAPLAGSLALGEAVSFADAQRQAGFTVVLPTAPDLGPPDATYLNGHRVALIWASRPGLPETGSPGVGLVISEFRGTVDPGFFEKILGPDTTVTKVAVGGSPGYWISGAQHFFFYIDPQGQAVNDDHPTVGDVLLWTAGDVTYRLETSLGMAAAVRLAESLR